MAHEQAAVRYLKALEATLAPDMVRGVYVVGSAALGSWRPGRSDLDVLVVLDRPMSVSDAAMIGEMHAVLEATRAAVCRTATRTTSPRICSGHAAR